MITFGGLEIVEFMRDSNGCLGKLKSNLDTMRYFLYKEIYGITNVAPIWLNYFSFITLTPEYLKILLPNSEDVPYNQCTLSYHVNLHDTPELFIYKNDEGKMVSLEYYYGKFSKNVFLTLDWKSIYVDHPFFKNDFVFYRTNEFYISV